MEKCHVGAAVDESYTIAQWLAQRLAQRLAHLPGKQNPPPPPTFFLSELADIRYACKRYPIFFVMFSYQPFLPTLASLRYAGLGYLVRVWSWHKPTLRSLSPIVVTARPPFSFQWFCFTFAAFPNALGTEDQGLRRDGA